MQLYIYARSGHNFGLENVRRASAIYKMLDECDPILATADYRAATFAKQNLDVKKGVGIDVIGNLPHMMERSDMLIYDDSGEASATMQEHMRDFCKLLYKVGQDIPYDIVDNDYFYKNNKPANHSAIFFGDDDYHNYFLDLALNSQKIDIPLILGHYFFLGNEDKLQTTFQTILQEDQYKSTIKDTKYLLTSSVHSCLESLASGNYPVFFRRYDKQQQNLNLLEKYNIPIIDIQTNNLDQIIQEFDKITKQYPQTKQIKQFDISQIKQDILKVLEIFKDLVPSLEYKQQM